MSVQHQINVLRSTVTGCPRACTNTRPRVGQGLRFKKIERGEPITWSIAPTNRTVLDSMLQSAMPLVMDEWMRPSQQGQTSLRFQRLSRGGDIKIGGTSHDGPGGTLAFVYQPSEGEDMGAADILADVHFDIDEQWDWNKTLNVGGHEIGHSVGLTHSDDPRALLYRFANGQTRLTDPDFLERERRYPSVSHWGNA